MGDFRWVGPYRSKEYLNGAIANSAKVQGALRAAAAATHAKIVAGHNVDEGHSFPFMKRELDRDYGSVDYYVGMNDERGDQAAFNILSQAMGIPTSRKGVGISGIMRRGQFRAATAAVKKLNRDWKGDDG